MSLSRGARRAAARGYNMIEVLMALSILAVGASGVIALQRLTILGVTEGRNLTAGTTVAAQHLEAARTDGAKWNTAADLSVAETPLLFNLMDDESVWAKPTGTGYALGFSDVSGRTSDDTLATPVAYCTHMRATEMADDLLLRVEARTFWAKSGRDVRAECDGPASDIDTLIGTSAADQYGWVFLSTSVRRIDIP